MKIIEEVARQEGSDPVDLDPLQKDVNTDALSRLCTESSSNITVIFDYEGHRVTVHQDGHIRIDE